MQFILRLASLMLVVCPCAQSQDTRDATSPNGMVVSVSPEASRVGADVLERGGNAVDATVATAFALAVTHPSAGNLGGGGFMLVHPGDGSPPAFIDYREKAPLAARPDMFAEGGSRKNHRYVGVPGTVRGLSLAHELYGSLAWEELVEPAVRLAAEGFEVHAGLARSLNRTLEHSQNDEFKRVYAKAAGDLWAAGDRLVLADLGRTLERIRDERNDGFYAGVTADLIAAEMERGGGFITREDLRLYRARMRTPIHFTYRAYDVYSAPPPSSGGITLAQMMQMLEPFELRKLGRWSPDTNHLIIEAMRRGYAQRAEHLGDADFVEIPSQLATKEHARQLASTIDRDKATPSTTIGPRIVQAPESDETTHFSVMDQTGMAVSNTYTLEASYGSGVVVTGAGFLLNNEMGDFNPKPGITDASGTIGTAANLIVPEKRMLSSMTPTIVLEDGAVRLVTGSPGGRTIINTVLCVTLNVLEFEMGLRAAVDAPRMDHEWFPDRVRFVGADEAPHIELAAKLRALGHDLRATSGQGDANSILVEDGGVLRGAADSPYGAAVAPQPRPMFDRSAVMIPMRDGVQLYTEIHVPREQTEALPCLLLRTPYNAAGRARRLERESYRALAREGYVFVFQDIRGKYGSEGSFEMLRPPRDSQPGSSAADAVDEGTDTWDTIEWLLANVPENNGRVGMHGVSYDGWLTVMALIAPHPALAAASPQASPDDMYLGDDFFHNGAFRLSYGFEYAAAMETANQWRSFPFDAADTYEWYLRLGPLANVNARHFQGRIPTWNNYVEHSNYDSFWQARRASSYLDTLSVPTLHVAGWWDAEDFYGPFSIYQKLEEHDDKDQNTLVVGPWHHGGWNGASGSSLGQIEFGTATARYFQDEIQARWFAQHLKDGPDPNLPEALTFRAGANEWVRHDAWPPRDAEVQRLYFAAGGSLAFDAPGAAEDGSDAFDAYLSDPAHPVPYRRRPVQATYGPGSTWSTWLVQDQRFAHLRPDVLSFETEPLKEEITISGAIVARLFASTTGTDSDWIVKLIDVYPEDSEPRGTMGGYQLMVANEVFRARFRESFEEPRPLTPGEVTEYTIDLHTQDYSFRQGHKIMVQVQSTWFPLIDRNPQTFVPNIFEAEATDYQPATQRVHRSSTHPSHLEIAVRR